MICNPTVPGKNGTVWRSGRGVADLLTGRAELHLDNEQTLNGSFDLNFTSANWSTSADGSSTWSRVTANGQRSSISLKSCENGSVIYNQDGYLSCAWKTTPPPRVGNLTGGGLLNPDGAVDLSSLSLSRVRSFSGTHLLRFGAKQKNGSLVF